MSQKKHKCFSQSDKLKIINAYEAGRTRSEIMLEFGLPLSSYYKIISNKDTTKQQCLQGKGNVRRNRSAEFPNVERCLLHWISQRIDRGLPLEGPAIKEKAKLFSVKLGINDFSASNGWLDGFKKRQGLIFSRSQHGETEKMASTVGKHGTDATDCFTNLLDEYEANDIYSITETGLFYKCTPDQIANYREKNCREGENAQERLTVLLCANLTGTDKLPILVIGQPNRSECLKGTNIQFVNYESNFNAWITRSIFLAWLTQVNDTMRKNERHIVLLVNHSPIHAMLPNFPYVKIVLHRSKSTMYGTQSLHKELVYYFKRNFRAELVADLLDCQKSQTTPSIHLPYALEIAVRAWDNIGSDTIVNCFMQAGCWPYALWDSLSPLAEKDDHILAYETNWDKLALHEPKASFSDYVQVDENVAITALFTDDDILEMVTKQRRKLNEKGNINGVYKTETLFSTRKTILRENDQTTRKNISTMKLRRQPNVWALDNGLINGNSKHNDTTIKQLKTIVRKRDAFNALETLHKFFERHIDPDATTFDMLYELKRCVRDVKA